MNDTRQSASPQATQRRTSARAASAGMYAVPARQAQSARQTQSTRLDQRRLRLRRRRRLQGLLRLFVLVVLVFALIWVGVRVAGASTAAPRHYIVRAGDTLWSIAQRSYGSSRDPRQVVYQIEHANQLHSADLQPGVDLVLPIIN